MTARVIVEVMKVVSALPMRLDYRQDQWGENRVGSLCAWVCLEFARRSVRDEIDLLGRTRHKSLHRSVLRTSSGCWHAVLEFTLTLQDIFQRDDTKGHHRWIEILQELLDR